MKNGIESMSTDLKEISNDASKPIDDAKHPRKVKLGTGLGNSFVTRKRYPIESVVDCFFVSSWAMSVSDRVNHAHHVWPRVCRETNLMYPANPDHVEVLLPLTIGKTGFQLASPSRAVLKDEFPVNGQHLGVERYDLPTIGQLARFSPVLGRKTFRWPSRESNPCRTRLLWRVEDVSIAGLKDIASEFAIDGHHRNDALFNFDEHEELRNSVPSIWHPELRFTRELRSIMVLGSEGPKSSVSPKWDNQVARVKLSWKFDINQVTVIHPDEDVANGPKPFWKTPVFGPDPHGYAYISRLKDPSSRLGYLRKLNSVALGYARASLATLSINDQFELVRLAFSDLANNLIQTAHGFTRTYVTPGRHNKLKKRHVDYADLECGVQVADRNGNLVLLTRFHPRSQHHVVGILKNLIHGLEAANTLGYFSPRSPQDEFMLSRVGAGNDLWVDQDRTSLGMVSPSRFAWRGSNPLLAVGFRNLVRSKDRAVRGASFIIRNKSSTPESRDEWGKPDQGHDAYRKRNLAAIFLCGVLSFPTTNTISPISSNDHKNVLEPGREFSMVPWKPDYPTYLPLVVLDDQKFNLLLSSISQGCPRMAHVLDVDGTTAHSQGLDTGFMRLSSNGRYIDAFGVADVSKTQGWEKPELWNEVSRWVIEHVAMGRNNPTSVRGHLDISMLTEDILQMIGEYCHQLKPQAISLTIYPLNFVIEPDRDFDDSNMTPEHCAIDEYVLIRHGSNDLKIRFDCLCSECYSSPFILRWHHGAHHMMLGDYTTHNIESSFPLHDHVVKLIEMTGGARSLSSDKYGLTFPSEMVEALLSFPADAVTEVQACRVPIFVTKNTSSNDKWVQSDVTTMPVVNNPIPRPRFTYRADSSPVTKVSLSDGLLSYFLSGELEGPASWFPGLNHADRAVLLSPIESLTPDRCPANFFWVVVDINEQITICFRYLGQMVRLKLTSRVFLNDKWRQVWTYLSSSDAPQLTFHYPYDTIGDKELALRFREVSTKFNLSQTNSSTWIPVSCEVLEDINFSWLGEPLMDPTQETWMVTLRARSDPIRSVASEIMPEKGAYVRFISPTNMCVNARHIGDGKYALQSSKYNVYEYPIIRKTPLSMVVTIGDPRAHPWIKQFSDPVVCLDTTMVMRSFMMPLFRSEGPSESWSNELKRCVFDADNGVRSIQNNLIKGMYGKSIGTTRYPFSPDCILQGPQCPTDNDCGLMLSYPTIPIFTDWIDVRSFLELNMGISTSSKQIERPISPNLARSWQVATRVGDSAWSGESPLVLLWTPGNAYHDFPFHMISNMMPSLSSRYLHHPARLGIVSFSMGMLDPGSVIEMLNITILGSPSSRGIHSFNLTSLTVPSKLSCCVVYRESFRSGRSLFGMLGLEFNASTEQHQSAFSNVKNTFLNDNLGYQEGPLWDMGDVDSVDVVLGKNSTCSPITLYVTEKYYSRAMGPAGLSGHRMMAGSMIQGGHDIVAAASVNRIIDHQIHGQGGADSKEVHLPSREPSLHDLIILKSTGTNCLFSRTSSVLQNAPSLPLEPLPLPDCRRFPSNLARHSELSQGVRNTRLEQLLRMKVYFEGALPSKHELIESLNSSTQILIIRHDFVYQDENIDMYDAMRAWMSLPGLPVKTSEDQWFPEEKFAGYYMTLVDGGFIHGPKPHLVLSYTPTGDKYISIAPLTWRMAHAICNDYKRTEKAMPSPDVVQSDTLFSFDVGGSHLTLSERDLAYIHRTDLAGLAQLIGSRGSPDMTVSQCRKCGNFIRDWICCPGHTLTTRQRQHDDSTAIQRVEKAICRFSLQDRRRFILSLASDSTHQIIIPAGENRPRTCGPPLPHMDRRKLDIGYYPLESKDLTKERGSEIFRVLVPVQVSWAGWIAAEKVVIGGAMSTIERGASPLYQPVLTAIVRTGDDPDDYKLIIYFPRALSNVICLTDFLADMFCYNDNPWSKASMWARIFDLKLLENYGSSLEEIFISVTHLELARGQHPIVHEATMCALLGYFLLR